MSNATLNNPNNSFWKKLLTPTIISIITIVIYYPSLWYGFIFDDLPTITKNFYVLGKEHNLSTYLFSNNRWISRFLNKFIYNNWQLNPFPYRTVNLIMFIITGFLVFFLVLTLLNNFKKSNFLRNNAYLISTITTALFLLHPAQTQTATYINQMQLEGLVVLFTFAILLSFVHAVKTNNIYTKIFLYALAFTLTIFSAGTKEIIIVLPFLVLLVDWFFLAQGDWKKLLSRIFIHVAIFALLFATLFKFNFNPIHHIPTAQTAIPSNRGNLLTALPTEKITAASFFISQFKVILHYIKIFFLPFGLSFDYDIKLSTSFWNFDVLFPLFILLSIIFTSLYLFIRNRANIISFCVAWFFIGILPRASFIPSTELICDYKTYISSFGVMLLIAIGLLKLVLFASDYLGTMLQSKKTFQYQNTLLIALLILTGFATSTRNKVWSNELEFWKDVVTKAPKKARAYNNYAVAFAQLGRNDEAKKQYAKSMECDPTYAEPVINMAFHYQSEGNKEMAMQCYQKALTLNEAHPEMFHNLATLHLEDNAFDKAESCLKFALKLRPKYSKAFYTLGITYYKQNKLQPALECFTQAINGDYQNIHYYYVHGSVAYNLKKYDQAIKTLETVRSQNNNYKNTLFLLANCYYNQRNYSKSSEVFGQMYDIAPENKTCAYNYAQSLLNERKFECALPLFEQCKDDPSYPYSYLHLAKCLAANGEKQRAKKELLAFIAKASNEQIKRDGQILLKELS